MIQVLSRVTLCFHFDEVPAFLPSGRHHKTSAVIPKRALDAPVTDNGSSSLLYLMLWSPYVLYSHDVQALGIRLA